MQFCQFLSSQLLMSQSILQRCHLIIQFDLLILKLLQPSLYFIDLAYVELPLYFLRQQVVLVGLKAFLFGIDFVGQLLQWSLMQMKAPYHVLRLFDLFVEILDFKLQLVELFFKFRGKYLGVLFKHCPYHQVVVVFLEILAVLAHLVTVGFEGQGVVCDFCHEVEDGEAVVPGMRGPDGLKHVLHEVAWVVEELKDAEDDLQVQLLPFYLFIECSGKDSEDIKEYF